MPGETYGFIGLDDLGRVELARDVPFGTDAILISNAVAVPEPGTFALLACGALALLASRRFRNAALGVIRCCVRLGLVLAILCDALATLADTA